MADMVYDAVIVGSGATGGWAAKELTEAGMQVALLEAGGKLDPAEYSEHTRTWEMKYRNKQAAPEIEARRPISARCYACEETNAHYFVDEIDNPWTTPSGKPFWWVRGRHVGGRTIMWGRQTYRLSDYDFKAASHDGYGEDWPFSYADLAPYYDVVERWIGVSGSNEGFDQLPDGQFLPPMAYSCGELEMKKAVNKMDRGFTIGRVAILTQNHRGRSACHYCGPCHRGCSTNSYFTSTNSTLPAAERTGRMTLITNAVVRHVTLNDKGLADGVFYFDKETRASREVKGKIVVLCASALESTRIMLNSTDRGNKDGLANSSGALGHYLMDHMYAIGAFGTFPKLSRKPENAIRPNGIYIPRFRNLHGDKQDKFIRGYGYQGGENTTVWEHAYAMKGFGKDFKAAVRDDNASRASLLGFGEMLPRWENMVSLDKEKVDAWGIPVLHIDCAHGDNEKAMAKDIVEQAKAMLEAAGAENVTTSTIPAPPGFGIHECGTARMGADAKKSVLNQWNQAHDVKNLFVMDGASFPSIACQNPTLTMMAMTVRACEYMVAEHKRGNLA